MPSAIGNTVATLDEVLDYQNYSPVEDLGNGVKKIQIAQKTEADGSRKYLYVIWNTRTGKKRVEVYDDNGLVEASPDTGGASIFRAYATTAVATYNGLETEAEDYETDEGSVPTSETSSTEVRNQQVESDDGRFRVIMNRIETTYPNGDVDVIYEVVVIQETTKDGQVERVSGAQIQAGTTLDQSEAEEQFDYWVDWYSRSEGDVIGTREWGVHRGVDVVVYEDQSGNATQYYFYREGVLMGAAEASEVVPDVPTFIDDNLFRLGGWEKTGWSLLGAVNSNPDGPLTMNIVGDVEKNENGTISLKARLMRGNSGGIDAFLNEGFAAKVSVATRKNDYFYDVLGTDNRGGLTEVEEAFGFIESPETGRLTERLQLSSESATFWLTRAGEGFTVAVDEQSGLDAFDLRVGGLEWAVQGYEYQDFASRQWDLRAEFWYQVPEVETYLDGTLWEAPVIPEPDPEDEVVEPSERKEIPAWVWLAGGLVVMFVMWSAVRSNSGGEDVE